MTHRERMDAFWRARTRVADPVLSTHFKRDGTHERDFAFIRSWVRPGSQVLDLGAGTCIVSSRIADLGASVLAVDKFPEFLAAAPAHPRLETCSADLLEFATERRFDAVLLFGVMNYFSADEAAVLYRRCAEWLSPGGVVLVKHQCGVEGDVVVDKFSEQIGSHYLAFYRHVGREETLLAGVFESVRVEDVYPAELNPWPDTHFYAFVAQRPVGRAR